METLTKGGSKIKNIDNAKEVSTFVLFLRQIFICSSTILNIFIFGLYIGATTVIIPQMRKEANSDDIITPEMVSWISSASGFSSLPWTIILPLIAYRFGRKACLILLNINTFIGNIIFYRSTTLTELLISQIIQGMVTSSVHTITVMVLTEYVSPRSRGMIMTFKSATFFWGIWISNIIGTFLHWKTIGILIFACCTYNFSIIFCPESPYWLATKGRFDECAKTHRWIKGTDQDAENELHILILSQEKNLNNIPTINIKRSHNVILRVYRVITGKKFYRPLFYMVLAISLYHFSGKLACSVYAIDIIKKITSSEDTAYEGMLILDGVTVFCAYVGCFLTNILKRRTQLFLFSSSGVCFLIILSIYLYTIKLNIISESKYVSLSLLTGFSISLSCGPMIISTCCFAELAPLKHRSSLLSVFGVVSSLILGFVVKITPSVFKTFECHGAFLFYAIIASVCLIGLYVYLPETKNKTIQEIESLISGEDRTTEEINESVLLKSSS